MKNLLYVVGIGPGNRGNMTIDAINAMEEADIIVGYTRYVDLVRSEFPNKEFLQTGMTSEVQRCQMAIDKFIGGKSVAMICSGDAGVYGMASLIYQLADASDNFELDKIVVIPGVTAGLSGAGILGSPLTNDYVTISLSNLLTPQEIIEKRLHAAASGDFCMAIYNPASKTRNLMPMAIDIMLEHIPPSTICAIARNIGREGESKQILTLGKLADLAATGLDMFCTVFIGNSQTKRIGDYMVTIRGYNV